MKADFGDNIGYGFNGFYDAMSTVDPDNPPVGSTFKISGQIYELKLINGELKFKLTNKGEIMSQTLSETSNTDVSIMRNPEEVLGEAKKAADALMQIVSQKKKPVIINNEQYLEFEDWQTLARFYGLTVKIVKTGLVDIGGVKGYESIAEVIRNTDGMIISAAESMCLNDEKLWKDRPLFQLRSMAQTRSCAKALRNVLAWVAVLAGFKPTPAEEMTDGVGGSSASDSKPNGNNKVITEKQGKRLLAIAKGEGYSREVVKEFVKAKYGYDHLHDIKVSDYDNIVKHYEPQK